LLLHSPGCLPAAVPTMSCTPKVDCVPHGPHPRFSQVEGVSQSSPTYAALAIVMVVLCALFTTAWLTTVANSMYGSARGRPGSRTARGKDSSTLAPQAAATARDGTPTAPARPLSVRRDRVLRASAQDSAGANITSSAAAAAQPGREVAAAPPQATVPGQEGMNPMFAILHPNVVADRA
jgi:hypothetical protein